MRLDPEALRLPSQLLTDEAIEGFFDARGGGLPGVYDWILNRDRAAFETVEKDIRTLFPSVKALRLLNVNSTQKSITIALEDGTAVPPNGMSEGLLYFLAFAALPYLKPTPLLLVEEPENGLHPARIADVMKVFRQLSAKGTQVIMATHSPLVINELKPEEVSIVTRDGSGTQVTPIATTKSFEERAKTYSLGELWVSYANGTDEAPLVQGTARP